MNHPSLLTVSVGSIELVANSAYGLIIIERIPDLLGSFYRMVGF